MCQNSKRKKTERSCLHFPEEVRFHFNYLVDRHDFCCVVVKSTFVRYESNNIFINIYHGRSSYEIGLEIGQLGSSGKPEEAFNISWLIKLVDPQRAADYKLYVAKTTDLVRKGVFQLCELFKKYAGKAIFADESTFTLLAKQTGDWKKSYAKEVLASQVRPKANAAFSNRNYGDAVCLYESIFSELTPAELKKLEFAQKQLS
jgi:hypothetical protein